ncbi:MAG: hypothetical protein R2720_02795 [Candidatus Nanopelagicales bacterium]
MFLLVPVVRPETVLGQRPSGTWIPVALIMALTVQSAWLAERAWASLAVPSATEWAQVKGLWSAGSPTTTGAFVQRQPFVVPGIADSSYDEFGILTGSLLWAAPSMHSLAARSILGIDIDPSAVTITDAPGTCESGPLVQVSPEGVLGMNPTRPSSCNVSP